MPKSILSSIVILVLAAGLYLGFKPNSSPAPSKPIRIGILIPMEHVALTEIVSGFEKVLNARYPNAVRFDVQSAQGDSKLQRSILDLFMGQKVDLIVPVGTGATLMTLSLIKEQPIISLAAQFPESERQKRSPKNITGVLDEIGAKKKLDFIQGIMPGIQHIAVVFHGANEKNFEEMEELKSYSKTLGIQLQFLMVQNLVDLETLSHAISPNAEAIFIGKDHLLASGIRLLVPTAAKRGIPLISSDEGTVQEGASLALGVREAAIGEAGGRLAIKVLEGQPIQDLAMESVEQLAVFYNPNTLPQKISLKTLETYAKQNHYDLLRMGTPKAEAKTEAGT